jgi:hypothetical protein
MLGLYSKSVDDKYLFETFSWRGMFYLSIVYHKTTYKPDSKNGFNKGLWLWKSVLLVEDTWVTPQVTDKRNHIRLYRLHLATAGFLTHTIGDSHFLTSIMTYHTKVTPRVWLVEQELLTLP